MLNTDNPKPEALELSRPHDLATRLRRFQHYPLVLAGCLTLVGLALRLYRLDARSFWTVEKYQAHVARFNTLDEVMSYTRTLGDVMPLMNILSWSMRGLGNNEWVIRLPAAIAGGLNVIAIYWLGAALVSKR